jgi:hypothetical protein
MVSTKGTMTVIVTALILAGAVCAVTFGQGNEEKITSVSNITVVDATNKVVGRVQSAGGDAATLSVGFVVAGVPQPIVLNVNRDKLYGAQGNGNVVFESTDCSGTPFLFRGLVATPPDRELSPQTAVVLPGSTLYVQDVSLSPQEIHAQSILTRTTPCTAQDMGTFTALPAKKMFDLDEEFTAPFTTR